MLNSIDGLEWKILSEKWTTLFRAFEAEEEIQRKHGDNFRQEIPLDREEVRRCRVGPSECFFKELPETIYSKYF